MAVLKVKKETEVKKASAKAETTKNTKDSLGRTYGTGRRKNAVARVWVKAGSGKITVNKKDITEYFPRETLHKVIKAPFSVVKMDDKFDVICTVKGGGHTGQAGAIKLGVARALDNFDSAFHAELRSTGMLTRDARIVERKKYGQHKARKSTQFSKR